MSDPSAREGLSEACCDWCHQPMSKRPAFDCRNAMHVGSIGGTVDQLVALSAEMDGLRATIAALIAERDAARAKVAAGLALADEWAIEGKSLVDHCSDAREVHEGSTLMSASDILRAALDGGQ